MNSQNYNCTYRRNKITLPPGARMDSLHTAEATQKFTLGMELELDDGTGRMFRYCKNSAAAALSKSLMTVAALLDAEQLAKVQTAYGASAGDIKFDILATTGHTITDHELIDGWLLVNDGGASMGDMYLIKDNYFTTDDTVINIELSEPLRTDVAATDDFTFIKSKFLDVIVAPTTQTNGGQAVGVPRCTVAKSYFFWAQFRGYCSIICDASDTIKVGEPCGTPGTHGTAGGVGTPANDGTDEVWGTCVYASTTVEAAIVDLLLP